MKTIKFFTLSIALLIGLALVSCQKNDDTEDQDVTLVEAGAYATDDASSSNSFDEIYTETDATASDMDEANSWTTGSKTKSAQIDSSKAISVSIGSGDTTVWPKTITITYSNWKTKSGHIIASGTITMTQTKRMIRKDAIRSISILNLVIDDSIRINGTKTITNKGYVSGKPAIEVKLEDGEVANLNTNKAITRQFTHTRAWEAGFNTPFNILDDTYSITGTASGVNRFGNAYTTTIQEKLILKPLCRWIISGIIEIKVAEKKPVTIDWGYPNTPSTCDRKFKVTYGDKVFNVE